MRILVNHSKADKPYLSVLAHILRGAGINALSTSKDLTIGELLELAKKQSCTAIVLSNEATLRYCVPGDKPTVDKWRGTRLNTPIPILIINKLEQLHTVDHGRWLLESDLKKLAFITKKATPFGYTVIEDVRQAPFVLGELSKALAIAYDIETTTFDSKDGKPVIEGKEEPEDARTVGKTLITCASWAAVFPDFSIKVYTLPLIDFGVDHWNTDAEYVKAIQFLRTANKLPVHKAMHNGMYDCFHSIRYHAEPYWWTYDTMGMAHSEFSELPKTLDFVASIHCYDYIYWKDDSDEAAKSKDIERYWGYNAKDAWYTARIMVEQLKNAPAYARENYSRKFKMVYPALYCNFEGIKVDENKRQELRRLSKIQLEEARGRLQTMFADKSFNPGSWQQVEKYIYKVYGASKPGLGSSKSCTDEMNLKSVATQHPLLARLVQCILNYREAQKAIGTYYDFYQYNDRLLYAIDPFGTESGRSACRASSLWCGTQVQNVPSYAKEMLVADEGFELFEADNKQSEGRTTAYCSQETNLIKALENAEKDFYKTLGELFFEIPYEKVTKEFRNKVIKRIVHGSNYMMGAGTFMNNVIKEVEEGLAILYKAAAELGFTIIPNPRKGRAKEMNLKQFVTYLLDSYHNPFPRIRAWYKEIKFEVKTTGLLVSPTGHTRKFFGDIEKNHKLLRDCVAHQPQNLSVEILDKGWMRVYKDLVIPHKGDFRLKAQIHDSLFGQWRIGMRDYFAPKVLACMNNPIKVHGRTLSIPVDIKYGLNWQEESKTNPNGTKEWKLAEVLKGS